MGVVCLFHVEPRRWKPALATGGGHFVTSVIAKASHFVYAMPGILKRINIRCCGRLENNGVKLLREYYSEKTGQFNVVYSKFYAKYKSEKRFCILIQIFKKYC